MPDTREALTDIAPETSGFMNTARPLAWLAEVLEANGGARRVTYGGAEQLEALVDEVLGVRDEGASDTGAGRGHSR